MNWELIGALILAGIGLLGTGFTVLSTRKKTKAEEVNVYADAHSTEMDTAMQLITELRSELDDVKKELKECIKARNQYYRDKEEQEKINRQLHQEIEELRSQINGKET